MEKEVRICTYCGEILEEYEGTTVGDGLLCDNCVDELCTTCDYCGETILIEDCVTDDRTSLCRECFNDYYRRCENCDNIIHDDSICWHNDLPYCSNCFDGIDYDDEIENYSYKPDPIFYGDSYMYFGVELEVDKGGKDDKNARTLKDIANHRHEHIYIKSDGSLNDGFEIISHPMTLEYHMNKMDWENVLHEAVNMGYRSHQTDTCGLHIHVNRNAFGENQAEQEEVIGKILFFIEKHWAEMFQFSRRSSYNMNRWSARFGFEKTGQEILKKAKDSNPITLFHFQEYGLYLYASTSEILKAALKNAMFTAKYENIAIHTGNIVRIDSDGKFSSSTFESTELDYGFHCYFSWYDAFEEDDDYEKDLLSICSCYGADRKDVELLLKYGYMADEVEDMLYNSDLFEEAASEVKSMLI